MVERLQVRAIHWHESDLMASTVMLHNALLVPHWYLSASWTEYLSAHSLSHSFLLHAVHMHSGSWGSKCGHWRMCRHFTKAHKLCFALLCYSNHVRKLLLCFKQTVPFWHLYTTCPTLSPCLPFLFPLSLLLSSVSLTFSPDEVPQHKVKMLW